MPGMNIQMISRNSPSYAHHVPCQSLALFWRQGGVAFFTKVRKAEGIKHGQTVSFTIEVDRWK